MSLCTMSVSTKAAHPRLMYWLLSAAYLTGTLRWLREPILRQMVRVTVDCDPVVPRGDHWL